MHDLCLAKELMVGPTDYGAFIKYPKKGKTPWNGLYYYSPSLAYSILVISSVMTIKSMIIPAAKSESSQTL